MKFVELKKNEQLQLTDFTDVWKVILYFLMADFITKDENNKRNLLNIFPKFKALHNCINQFNQNALNPEIKTAIRFVEEANKNMKVMFESLRGTIGKKNTMEYSVDTYQQNLSNLQRNFEECLFNIRYDKNYVIFVDGLDVRPDSLTVEEYLNFIRCLAEAASEINRKFFERNDVGIRFVLLFRPDVFSRLRLQNINLIFREESVFLNWRTGYGDFFDSELFKTIDNILSSQNIRDNRDNQELKLGVAWENYFPWYVEDSKEKWLKHYGNKTSFIDFLRLSYHRPRDILILLQELQAVFCDSEIKRKFTVRDFNRS